MKILNFSLFKEVKPLKDKKIIPSDIKEMKWQEYSDSGKINWLDHNDPLNKNVDMWWNDPIEREIRWDDHILDIEDIFQEYVDKFNLKLNWAHDFYPEIQNKGVLDSNEVSTILNNTCSMEEDEYIIFTGSYYTYVIISTKIPTSKFNPYIDRLKKFGYSCEIKDNTVYHEKLRIIIIKIDRIRKSNYLQEAKSEYLLDIEDLFQEYIDKFKLKRANSMLTGGINMKVGEYKIIPTTDMTYIVICDNIPLSEFDPYLIRLRKFGYTCTMNTEAYPGNKKVITIKIEKGRKSI